MDHFTQCVKQSGSFYTLVAHYIIYELTFKHSVKKLPILETVLVPKNANLDAHVIRSTIVWKEWHECEMVIVTAFCTMMCHIFIQSEDSI